MEFVLIVTAVWLFVDAIKGYKAEKYAQKTVFNRDISFFDFMCSHHPIMATCMILLIILIVIAIGLRLF